MLGVVVSSCKDFYPRSPCGERPAPAVSGACAAIFLSTLSLRRATHCLPCNMARRGNFYPRSPCGERRCGLSKAYVSILISIHALLAESDPKRRLTPSSGWYFYPRSPCGERRHTFAPLLHDFVISIHALLAESDRMRSFFLLGLHYFYPRSPCGERLKLGYGGTKSEIFLSTLSLRRATGHGGLLVHWCVISIHALLAESDPAQPKRGPDHDYFYPRSPCGERLDRGVTLPPHKHFYPRSPCGERLDSGIALPPHQQFLSTLSLRRAT